MRTAIYVEVILNKIGGNTMSMFDSIFKKEDKDESPENIGKLTSDKAVDLIKTLSGGEVKYTKKIVDNVIVFTGASGGTGVSTILSNVAYLAAEKGLKVLVIDLNVMYPVQHIYFGGNKTDIERADLVGYLLGKNSFGDAIETNGNVSLLYAHNRTLLDWINIEADSAVANFNEALHKARALFDLVLIDCPMSIEHTVCNMVFYHCDSIYLVWDEGISSITNTEKIRRNMATSGIDAYTKMKVILNKRTSIQYNRYPFQKLNIALVQILPFEPDIIYSSLRSEVFCNKGASKSKNANIFYNSLIELTDTVLKNGGYVK